MKKALKLLSNNSAYNNVFSQYNLNDNMYSHFVNQTNKYANTYDKFIQLHKAKIHQPKDLVNFITILIIVNYYNAIYVK